MTKQHAQLRAFKNGRVIIPHLEVAANLWTQTVGLMGRNAIVPDGGLFIPHCNAIHTAFVRFPIDVIFLDEEMKVVRLVPELRPWKIVGFVRGAKSVVELPAGTLRQKQIVVGQQFALHLSAPERTGERT
jgi:uncharacterized membrane protein (UPF0127 family)